MLTQLKVACGKQFVYLAKASKVLASFLCGVFACKRPLAKSTAVEKLTKLRDQAYREFGRRPNQEPGVAGDVAQETDLVDLLGLNANEEATSPPPQTRRARRRQKLQVPPTSRICFERPGMPPWEPTVLMEASPKAVAIEVTEENLHTLLELVDDEVTNGAARRPQYGAASKASRKAPRGPRDRREYFVRNRWVIKIKDDKPTPESPAKPPVRTLIRRRSDEAAGTRKRRARGQGAHAAGDLEQSPFDCLAG